MRRWCKGLSRIVATAGALAAMALASGCSNFQDESTIVDLRILGIKADPPEIYVDPKNLIDPNNPVPTDDDKIFTSTLTALVLDPAGQGRQIDFAAYACPRAIDTITAATGRNGVVCPHDDPTTIDLLDPPGLHQTADIGAEHDIMVPFAVSPNQLWAAYMLDPQARDNGFQLPAVVQIELSAGTESIVATKRVIFSQQVTGIPAQTPNENPVIATVTTYGARDAMKNPIGPGELVPGASVTVPLGGALWFEPGGAVAEAYSIPEATREVPPQIIAKMVPHEALRYAYFASAGSFSPAETSTVPPVFVDQGQPIRLESQYRAPGTMPADPNVTIWIVVRDERGGASWTTRQIVLAPP